MIQKITGCVKGGVIGIILICLVIIGITPASGVSREDVNRSNITADALSVAVSEIYGYEDISVALELTGDDFAVGQNSKIENNILIMENHSNAMCKLNVEDAGNYKVVFDVYVSSRKPIDNLLNVKLLKEELRRDYSVILPVLWKDESKIYSTDRFGNETVPTQIKVDEFVQNTARLDTSLFGEELEFALEKGEYILELNNEMEEIKIRSIMLIREEAAVDYNRYRSQFSEQSLDSMPCVVIEAEDYAVKTDSYISPGSVKNTLVHPFNNDYDFINILDGASFSEAGQEVSYVVEIPKTGLYSLAFVYSQMNVEDMSCYRTIKIDGNVLYQQMEDVAFPYTSYKFFTKVFADSNGNEYKIFLEEGTHTLSMKTDVAPYEEEITKLNQIMGEIRELSLDIKKVTGNSTDKYRSWNMNDFIPGISDSLYGIADEMDAVYCAIESKCDRKPSFASTLKVASANIRTLAAAPDKLPNNMALFSDGSSSASQRLADVCDSLQNQAIDFDRIYLFGDKEDIAQKKITVFKKVKNEVVRFAHSFSEKYQGYNGAQSKNSDSLVVWMNRPIQYVTLLQQIVDSEFTQKTGIDVEIYIMPNESKLVLSNASGSNPDVALSVSNQTPYNLALRGAAYPLSEFEDFYDYLSDGFNVAAYSGLVLDNQIYGTVETSDFYVMVYRKDILDSLGISVPQTWDDVIGIMPKLNRYGMNFYTPIAGNKGSKYLHETTPYLFQAGASVLAGDGLSVDFTSEESYKGFERMTDLYLKYSLSQDTPNFYNNFRYGTMPIGIINYSTYVLLENAAPEIKGEWEMTLVPGTVGKDGTIHRYQVAGDKCDMIFNNSSKQEEAWEFLKWWMSEDVQLEYANLLMTHYGPEYFWNTSNMKAFANYSMDKNDIETIIDQWTNHTKELQKHPAVYMIEREISNVWSSVVVNGRDLRTTLVQAEQTVNREIQVKLKEFGYISNGEMVSDYPILTDEELLQLFSQFRK